MQFGVRTTNENDLSSVELHVFLQRTSRNAAEASYEFDDGESTAYRQGETSSFSVRVRARGHTLKVEFCEVAMRYRPARVRIVAYDAFREVIASGLGRPHSASLVQKSWKFMGSTVKVWSSKVFEVS
jgi:hypothetical protein